MKCILNGSVVPVGEAKIGISDLSIRRGYGLFDFLRIYNNAPFYLDQHIRRLFNGIDQLQLIVPFSQADISSQVVELAKENNISGESGMRIVITGGISEDGITPAGANIIVTQEPMKTPTREMYENGVGIITQEYCRDLPLVKSINYLTAIYYKDKIKKAGAIEILYHENDKVSECSRSNIFCVKDEVIYTPENNVLEGVTRQNVLREMKKEFQVEVVDFSPDFLLAADEVFLTSTIKRILPVSHIDETRFSVNGIVTKRAMEIVNALDLSQRQI